MASALPPNVNKRITPGARNPKGEGGSTIRKNGYAQVTHVWYDDFDVRHVKYFYGSPKAKGGAMAQAEGKKKDWLAKHSSGVIVEGDKTVGELFNFCFGKNPSEDGKVAEVLGHLHQKGRGLDLKARKDDRRRAEVAWRRLRSLKLNKLEVRHIDQVSLENVGGDFRNPERPRSAQLDLVVLKICLDEAKRQGWLRKDNPASLAYRVPYERSERRTYSLEQMLRLMDVALQPMELSKGMNLFSEETARLFADLRTRGAIAIRGLVLEGGSLDKGAAGLLTRGMFMALYDRAWMALGGFMGLREDECAGLNKTDYNRGGRLLSVVRQGKRDALKSKASRRTLEVPSVVAEALNVLIEALPYLEIASDSVFLFPSTTRREKRTHQSTIYHRSVDLMKRAGLDPIDFHELRHTASRIYDEAKVKDTAKRDILGHTTTQVGKDVYTHSTSEDITTAFRAVQRRVNKQKAKGEKAG